jgi:hypothetical protein
MRSLALSFLVVSMVTGAGCRQAGLIRAESARYPVSLSESVYGPNLEVLSVEEGVLEKLGTFEDEMTFWKIGWGYKGYITDDWDISSLVNQAIEQYHGEAVVRLNVEVENCGLTKAGLYFPPLSFLEWTLPFYPSCTTAIVSGTVVRRAAPR